jgi:hypothetical protein
VHDVGILVTVLTHELVNVAEGFQHVSTAMLPLSDSLALLHVNRRDLASLRIEAAILAGAVAFVADGGHTAGGERRERGERERGFVKSRGVSLGKRIRTN